MKPKPATQDFNLLSVTNASFIQKEQTMSEHERSKYGFNLTTGQRRPSRLTRLGHLVLFLMVNMLVAVSGSAQQLWWDVNGPLAGAGGPAPTGLWDGASTSWSSSSAGTAATSGWVPGATAIFAAGSDASGTYSITLSGAQSAGGVLFEDGNVALSGDGLDLVTPGNVTVNASLKATINSVIGGSVGLTKLAVGELVLGAANTFNGSLTHRAGALTLNDPRAASQSALIINPASDVLLRSDLASLTLANDIVLSGVANALVVEAGPNKTLSLNGNISGTHNWQIRGGGRVILDGGRGVNTFDGGLLVTESTVVVAKDQALGAVVNDTTIASGATIAFQGNVIYRALNGSKRVIVNGAGFGDGPAIRNLADDNIFSGDIVLGASSTVGVDAGSLNLNGPIIGNFNLTKVGPGVLDLTGVGNNYNSTLVSAGALGVWGNAIAGSGLMTVSAGAFLEGNGNVPGGVNLFGTISPGASPDRLTTGPQTWNSGAAFLWEVSDFNGTVGGIPGTDFVQINGQLTIAATSQNKFTIYLATLNPNDNSIGLAANFNNTAEYSFPIVTASGGIVGFDPEKFVVDTSQIMNDIGNGVFYMEQSGNSIVIRFIQKPVITQGLVDATFEECKNYTLSVTATGTAPLSYAWTHNGQPVGTDSPTLTITGATPADAGTYQVVVSNISGSTATSTAVVTVIDPKPIIAGCPADITVETPLNATACSMEVSWTAPTASDNCAVSSFVSNFAPGATFPVGTTTVVYTATDDDGQITTCSFTVTVLEKTPPTPVFNTMTVQLDSTGSYTLSVGDIAQISAGSTDNCGTVVASVSPSALTFCDVGSKAVVLTVTDASGNAAQANGTLTVLAPTAAPTVVYVDASYPTTCAAVTFPNVGGTGTYYIGYNAFKTIDAGLTAVAAGGIVNVAAGTYIESLEIDKPVALVGPNAGKSGTATDRAAEAVIRPSNNDPENTPIISVVTSEVTVDGFELNGNNPALSSGYTVNGVEVHAAAAVQNGVYPTMWDVDAIRVQNNVIKNVSYDGVYLDRYGFYTTTSGFNYVVNNLFDNMWEGLLTYGVEAVISGNTVASATKGLSVHVAVVPPPVGFTPVIANNTVTIGTFYPEEMSLTRIPGIWVNYRRENAVPLTVVSNVVNTPVAAPRGNYFLALYALSIDGQGKVNFVDNVVNGAGNCAQGAFVALCPVPGAVTISGGSLNQISETGVRADTIDRTWGTNDAFVTIENVAITVTAGANGVLAIQQPGTEAKAGVTVIGGSVISGGAAGVKVLGANATATVRGSAIVGNQIGVDVDAGKALIESNNLANNSIAGIEAVNGGIVDAGDCTGSNVTGLGTGSGQNGSSAGANNLSGYGFDAAAPWAILSTSTAPVLGYQNLYGAVTGDYIANVLSGNVLFSQLGGAPIKCPAPVTLQCTAQVPPALTTFAAFLAAGGTVPGSEGTVASEDALVETVPGTYTITRTYVLTDGCGQATSCEQVFAVDDTQAPVITACAQPASVPVISGTCEAPLPNLTGLVTATDNCTPAEALVVTQSPAAGTLAAKGAYTVTLTVTDIAGNATTCEVAVSVVDTTPPVISCPANVVRETAPDSCTAVVIIRSATASDACGAVDLVGVRSDSLGLTEPYPKGTTVITWTATDLSGNTASCEQLVTVEDRTAPVISCPANIVQATDVGQLYATVTFAPTATDNCAAVVVTAVPASGSQFPVGTTPVQVTAVDADGNTSVCTFTVTVQALPIITSQPQSLTLPAGSTAVFSVAVSPISEPPIAYQWYRNGVKLVDDTNISGSTTAQLTLLNVIKADEGSYTVELSNVAGTVLSAPATLTVLDPYIVAQPVSVRRPLGGSASFTVVAAGTPDLTYQWYQDGILLLGETGATLTVDPIRDSDEGAYVVVVSNPLGSLTSEVANLDISHPPVVAIQPLPVTVWEGEDAMFTVKVNGAIPFTYQWYHGTVAVPGATGKTLVLNDVTAADAGNYFVAINNADGSTNSLPALLTVLGAPIIIAGPDSRTNLASTTATFEVEVEGEEVSYQWFFNGTELVDGGQITGATSNVLAVADLLAVNEGEYWVVVSNRIGTATSTNAVLTVIDPAIIQQPAGVTNQLGKTAVFTVVAAGTGPLTYQWQWNGIDLIGENDSVLTVTLLADSDAGLYTVVVTGAEGSVTSEPALLVTVPPMIKTQPANVIVNFGQPAQLSVDVNGDTPFTYVWQKNVNGSWVDIADSDDRIYSIAVAGVADEGTYRVIVSNEVGFEISEAATLTVITPPSNLTIGSNEPGTLTLTVTGGSGRRYTIQASDDCVNWTDVHTAQSPFIYSVPMDKAVKLYRTILVP
jgi:hypothetical protein